LAEQHTVTTFLNQSILKLVYGRGGIRVEGIRRLLKDEAGVEPIVMKLLAAVVLLALGLSIGVALYKRAGSMAENFMENIENA
jgi:hypothetical protein